MSGFVGTVLALLALVLAARAANPEPPQIPETFSADIRVEFHDPEITYFGAGRWDRDFSRNMSLENYTLEEENRERIVYRLTRYDKKIEYEVNAYSMIHCTHTTLMGEQPFAWKFLSTAEYVGQREFHSRSLDIWETDMADVRVEVGVDPEMANVPVILTRHFPGAEQVYEFATFNATAPNPDVFTIPAECQD
ncbi:uncharacterized protein [Oscarella lobularis]|uniref:uncharacterized protein n=1 Tax=Oscarella lobularis TaxID=121494 RepID=UPI0033142C91